MINAHVVMLKQCLIVLNGCSVMLNSRDVLSTRSLIMLKIGISCEACKLVCTTCYYVKCICCFVHVILLFWQVVMLTFVLKKDITPSKIKNNMVRLEWLGAGLYQEWPTDIGFNYSWERLAILVAGKGRGDCFNFFYFFTFIPVPLSSLSLSFISSTISSIYLLPFSGKRHKMTHKGRRVVKLQNNQSI